ncbi:DUF6079 family protein [Arthrobacter rhombi]|uniref:DUF6079 family protein n=1 Tax=Arthrobacter rhombi TaxID=71253 RepID=UPI003FD69F70
MKESTVTNFQMPLRDAIHIQREVHDDDFVLQINRIGEASAQMVRDYVVTDDIAAQFDEGLSLVSAAVNGPNHSKGAFVHGSFGSGKSHFMAIMHLLLTGDAAARSVSGLAGVIGKYQGLLSKNFLAVDYHLIGATSFDDALFSGYLQTIKAKHPDAPVPVLHRSDSLLVNADQLRERMGDEKFFAPMMGLGGEASSGWGSFATQHMSALEYDAARFKPAGDPARDHLVAQLIEHHFPSAENTGTWLGMTEGLQAMTRHAKALGYDGMILFLDELVLWLSNHLRNSEFIATETSKVTKLVETGAASLDLPLISFVARQRNLKDFLGDTGVGAEKVAVDDNFKHWESRFTPITLPATSLPQIVHKRLLQPIGPEGADALKGAYQQVSTSPLAQQHLLLDEAKSDGVAFEQVYPFAPALIDAMIALSNVMQRSRTALKIMSELLARGYDDLTVSDVIQAGDIFDLVVLEDSKGPLDSELKPVFAAARDFYLQKMRPYLLSKHNLDESQAKEQGRDSVFRREDRLIKTLLIAALVPNAPSLKNLTASKLAALNFGSVKAMIAGFEAQQVVGMVAEWAAEFGEISIAPGVADPVITLTLSGVDVDSILGQVVMEDRPANRISLIRRILAEEIGAEKDPSISGGDYTLQHIWRGQKHDVDIVFGNLRDTENLKVESIRAQGGRWRLVIDYPFDDDNKGPQDDVVRLQTLREAGEETDTIAWMPQFLTSSRVRDIGLLVQLEYLLTGSMFDKHAGSLAVADREPARRQLTSQHDSLKAQLLTALKQAYGLESPNETHVSSINSGWHTFRTLAPDFDPHNPASATFSLVSKNVLASALDARFPDHPKVENPESEIKRGELTAVLDLVRSAVPSGGRIESVDRATLSKVRRVITGYGIGTLNESTYYLAASTFRWNDRFLKASVTDPMVSSLRSALTGYGLTDDAEELLILTWAELSDRQLVRQGNVLPPLSLAGPVKLTADVVLREPSLPEADQWATALGRARDIFSVAKNEHALLSSVVSRVAQEVRKRATALAPAANLLVAELTEHRKNLGLGDASPRMSTAHRGSELVTELAGERDDLALLELLAQFDIPGSVPALQVSLDTAEEVSGRIQGANWQLIDKLSTLGVSGSAPLEELQQIAGHDQLSAPLQAALTQAVSAATTILSRTDPGSSDPGVEARKKAEEERRRQEEAKRRAQDEADRLRWEKEQQLLKEAQQKAAESERARLQAEAELKRLKKEADEQKHEEEENRRAEEERKREEPKHANPQTDHSMELSKASDINDLGSQLATEFLTPVDGKTLTVTWRWK